MGPMPWCESVEAFEGTGEPGVGKRLLRGAPEAAIVMEGSWNGEMRVGSIMQLACFL
jgi:hypothetical protein